MKAKTRVLRGRVFNVFFSNMYDKHRKPGAVTHCVVIADDIEEAIRLAKAANGNEPIDMVSVERDHRWAGSPAKKPAGDMIVTRI